MTKRLEEIFFEGLKGEKLAAAPIEEPKLPAEAPVRPVSERNLFSHPDAHPIVLDFALLRQFKLEWLTWLPDTLFHEIELTFKTSLSEINKLKIMATKTMHVTDSYWEHWEVFEKILLSLNGVVPRFDTMQPLDLPMLMAGVDMAKQLRDETYSEEVARYAAACMLHENVLYAPAPIDFCQEYITQPMYRCKDCGQVGTSRSDNTAERCVSCSGMHATDKPFDGKPDEDAERRGHGKNLEHYNTYELEPVKKRFEELEAMPPEKVGEAIHEVSEDIQAAKLIAALDYTNVKRKQLTDQLSALRNWLEMA